MSDCPLRRHVFEVARRRAEKDLEGFDRAVKLLLKRREKEKSKKS